MMENKICEPYINGDSSHATNQNTSNLKLLHDEGYQQKLMTFENMLNALKSNNSFDNIEKANDAGSNIFYLALLFETVENFEFIVEKLKTLTSKKKIKELFSGGKYYKINLFQEAAKHKKPLEFHISLWTLMKEYFDSDEILEMLKLTDENENNFLHNLVLNDNAEIIKYTCDEITLFSKSCNASHDKLGKVDEILKSKGEYARNLLQIAAFSSKDVKTFEILWNLFQKNFNSNEDFLAFLRKVDGEGDNIFVLAVCFTTAEIFEFIMKRLKELTSQLVIKEFLSSTGLYKRNLLQAAGRENKCSKFHTSLWTIMKEYFKPDEILQMITYADKNGDNLLHNVIDGENTELIQFTWDEINFIVVSCKKVENKSEKLQEMLKSKGYAGRNMFHMASNVLKYVKTFENLWNIFKKEFDSVEGFLPMLNEADHDGNNFFNLAASFTTKEIFEFVMELLKKVTKPQSIKKFLSSTGYLNRNLLQEAARQNKSSKFHISLWRVMKEYYNSDEILDMITHADKNGDILLHNAVLSGNVEIIEFTLNEIIFTVNSCNKIQDKSVKLREILKSKGYLGRNLFLKVAFTSKDIKTIEFFWKIIRDLFSSNEDILAFLRDVDEKGNNICILAAYFTTAEIFEFIMKMLKELTTKPIIKEILSKKGWNKRNLLQVAGKENKSHKFHTSLWRVIKEYFSSDEVLEMITYADELGNNLLHNTVLGGNPEIIQLTWNEIIAIVDSNSNIRNKSRKSQEILKSKGYAGRNLLQQVAHTSENKETHQCLWKILSKFSTSVELLIREKTQSDGNILHIAIFYSTKEICEYTWTQIIEIITNKEDQIEFLKQTNPKGKNILKLSMNSISNDIGVKKWVNQILIEHNIQFSD